MLNIENLFQIKGFRFPRSVIGYAVRACHRFALSLRDVENLLVERDVTVSYETIRDWVNRLGHQFTAKIRRDRSALADKWHLDEVVIRIKGRSHWLLRAVDAKGDVLEILTQSRRNKAAAHRFLRKLIKRWGQPRVQVTDRLRSYGAAKEQIAPGVEHRQHKGLNNRSEASHWHTRRREKFMSRFKSPRQAQQFLSVHDQIANLFRPKRQRLSARSYRHARSDAFGLWAGYVVKLTA
ncbi:IS6 family transposase [Leisingera daeponensis]|uniref:IS6 family transposase n=1 Tax=Leisingera daeponensis TaxID=405746 RepID=A0ABS7NM21_9RHOB|nr:IS6 family transposase [Leisingera daeponensis]MBY6142244.1 IS6 family transposase [Leisingera daeponensis]